MNARLSSNYGSAFTNTIPTSRLFKVFYLLEKMVTQILQATLIQNC